MSESILVNIIIGAVACAVIGAIFIRGIRKSGRSAARRLTEEERKVFDEAKGGGGDSQDPPNPAVGRH